MGKTGIILDSHELMNQAPSTINSYLLEGIGFIDRAFATEGYAKNHPELLGAFITACSSDCNASIIAKEIGNAIHELCNSVDSLPGGNDDSLDKIADALQEISSSINHH